MAVPLESWKEFEKHVLHYKGSKIVVVDFWAASCGDCIVLAPFFYTLAEKNKQCDFYEVDVEETTEVANWAKIKKLPTIKFYKYGQCIETIEGGAQGKISAAVAKHKNA
ncbi:thioredoxin-like [Bolinopsis microptera]|uniref:thioredoxin-like n=1 Tax=Bolinopsis microptera TaxID=2820187 RepID=UPI00307AD0D0